MLDIQTAIDTINKVNSRHSAILISTFDFSSLFINIPHHKLKSVIEELINFCFNGRNEKCIGIFGYGATWTNNQQKYRLSFNKTSLTYFCPVFPYYTSLKKSKNLGLSDAFRGYKQGTPDINGLKLPINYLLDNCYFTLGSMRYCQLT